jgi:GDP-L-fucose synthase
MNLNAKIYVAGHRGMVGSAIVRCLQNQGYNNLIVRTSSELDLRSQQAVFDFFEIEQPDYIFLAAAKVGGIMANNIYRADFLYENLQIQNNVIHAAYLNKVAKLLFLGSSCIYPKLAEQPLKEDSLLTGLLEETNEPYAIAKIAGIKMCESYRRQYGCNFVSHVLPAMIRKFHEAKIQNKPQVELWGTGSPLREFMHADDMAAACVYLMQTYNDEGFVNIGVGNDVSIKQLAEMIQAIVGYTGTINWNSDKPNGTPRKLMDVSKLHSLGWKHRYELFEGITKTYQDFLAKEQEYSV